MVSVYKLVGARGTGMEIRLDNRPFLHKDFGCPEACLMAAPSGCSVFQLQKVVNWSHILCFLSKIEPSQLHLCTWQPGFPYAKRDNSAFITIDIML